MIQHLFFTMMHFIAGLLMRIRRKQPLLSQKLKCHRDQEQMHDLFTTSLSLTHRKDQRFITPLTKRFQKALGLHHGNDGKVYLLAFKSNSPGWRYALDLGQSYLKKVVHKIVAIKTNDAPKIMKFMPGLNDGPMLIRS